MSDVKRYTDYGGMIDCETNELSGHDTGIVYVKASDYDELHNQLEKRDEALRVAREALEKFAPVVIGNYQHAVYGYIRKIKELMGER